MLAILNVVLPVFGIILAGYLCGRFRLLDEASSEALNRFVYFLALPALFFISIARVGVADVLNWRFLAGYGGGVIVTAVVAVAGGRRLFANRLAAQGLHGLSAIFANTGYMGIPLLVTAFGPAAALPAIIATVLNGAVIMALGLFVVEIDMSRDRGAGVAVFDALVGVAKSPLVLAAAGGILCSSLGLAVPEAAARFCDILGAAAPPAALFAIGLFLVGRSLTAGLAETGWLVLHKLLVQPLVTAAIVFGLLPMERPWAASAVALAALPTGSLVFVLAQQYGVYVQRATAAILVSTVLSIVTLFAVFALLGIG
jgi:malonate transporter and related proteins